MKHHAIAVCCTMLLAAVSAGKEFHPDARRAFNVHWLTHPEHPESLVRLWHQRLFHHEIAAPLLTRLLDDLKRGIEAPLALAELLASPEFYINCGSTPDGFVRKTFVEVVGRQPTEAEFRFWHDRLYHADRKQVAHEMVTRYPPAWAMETAHPVEHFEYRAPIARYHR
jgi:hypothetical protein